MIKGWSLLLACCLAAPAWAGSAASPDWDMLAESRRQALAPLARDWNRYSAHKKQSLLELADALQRLTPEARERAQRQLRRWVELSPAEQARVRANWLHVQRMAPERRAALLFELSHPTAQR